jgi:hypothetical protein
MLQVQGEDLDHSKGPLGQGRVPSEILLQGKGAAEILLLHCVGLKSASGFNLKIPPAPLSAYVLAKQALVTPAVGLRDTGTIITGLCWSAGPSLALFSLPAPHIECVVHSSDSITTLSAAPCCVGLSCHPTLEPLTHSQPLLFQLLA